jgi:hypothetical protein
MKSRIRIPWILAILFTATLAVASQALAQQELEVGHPPGSHPAHPHHHGAKSFTPRPNLVQSDGRFRSVPAPAAPAQGCVEDPSLKPGDKGHKHCDVHPHYPTVFTTSNCACTAGECRPTVWHKDTRSPVGIAVKFNGKWCPIKNYLNGSTIYVPEELRRDPAHTCVNDNAPLDKDGCPTNSCNLINGLS